MWQMLHPHWSDSSILGFPIDCHVISIFYSNYSYLIKATECKRDSDDDSFMKNLYNVLLYYEHCQLCLAGLHL